jgi:thymidylate synthase ThyX
MIALAELNNPTREDIEKVFYNQPMGVYPTRTGYYAYTDDDYSEYMLDCLKSAKVYAKLVDSGIPGEVARRSLTSGFRHNFTMAGTLRDVFHWLDQRTLTDTQIEAQTLAHMALEELKAWCPEFFEWYGDKKAGKNKLAP